MLHASRVDGAHSEAEEIPVAELVQGEQATAMIERLVEELADGFRWNWTRMLSYRDAADLVLRRMSELGIIEERKHPFGGSVWRVNGRMFGRLDDVANDLFDGDSNGSSGAR